MTTAIFPGKFDPVTMGHLDIIKRASRLFNRVVVAVFEGQERELLFTTEERIALTREAIGSIRGVEVDSFRGLVVDYARSKGAEVMVRGLRLNTDFEYEFEMALMNRKLAPDVDVVCLMTDIQYQFVRASLLKEVARLGGDIGGLAPPNVIKALGERFGK